jgi:hypothetical protein
MQMSLLNRLQIEIVTKIIVKNPNLNHGSQTNSIILLINEQIWFLHSTKIVET